MRKTAALALTAAAVAAALTGFAATAASAYPGGWTQSECRPGSPGVARTSWTCGAELVNGRAIPPPSAPPEVKAVIRFANHIDGRAYVWGGGHGSFTTKGYDCSGAVSYALHGGGLLDYTMVSGELARWGVGGVGRWISVYANDDHVYMVVAGLRYDTRDDPPGVSGPRWHTTMADPRRFKVRHPPGL